MGLRNIPLHSILVCEYLQTNYSRDCIIMPACGVKMIVFVKQQQQQQQKSRPLERQAIK